MCPCRTPSGHAIANPKSAFALKSQAECNGTTWASPVAAIATVGPWSSLFDFGRVPCPEASLRFQNKSRWATLGTQDWYHWIHWDMSRQTHFSDFPQLVPITFWRSKHSTYQKFAIMLIMTSPNPNNMEIQNPPKSRPLTLKKIQRVHSTQNPFPNTTMSTTTLQGHQEKSWSARFFCQKPVPTQPRMFSQCWQCNGDLRFGIFEIVEIFEIFDFRFWFLVFNFRLFQIFRSTHFGISAASEWVGAVWGKAPINVKNTLLEQLLSLGDVFGVFEKLRKKN